MTAQNAKAQRSKGRSRIEKFLQDLLLKLLDGHYTTVANRSHLQKITNNTNPLSWHMNGLAFLVERLHTLGEFHHPSIHNRQRPLAI